MKYLFFIGIFSTLLLFSCKKDIDDNQDNDTPEPIPNYTPMSLGNYWVYNNYEIDTNGNERDMEITDSVFIEKDTIIRGKTFYVYKGTRMGGQLRRLGVLSDSAGFLINYKGDLIFTVGEFYGILSSGLDTVPSGDTLYTYETKMAVGDFNADVDAGSFSCKKLLNIYTIYWQNEVPEQRIAEKLYSEDVGLILNQYFYISSDKYIERRLVRYNITK